MVKCLITSKLSFKLYKDQAFLQQAVSIQKCHKHDWKISPTDGSYLNSHPEQSPEQNGEVPSHLKSSSLICIFCFRRQKVLVKLLPYEMFEITSVAYYWPLDMLDQHGWEGHSTKMTPAGNPPDFALSSQVGHSKNEEEERENKHQVVQTRIAGWKSFYLTLSSRSPVNYLRWAGAHNWVDNLWLMRH